MNNQLIKLTTSLVLSLRNFVKHLVCKVVNPQTKARTKEEEEEEEINRIVIKHNYSIKTLFMNKYLYRLGQ